MSWLSEFIKDSEDWTEEVFSKLLGKVIEQAVKEARLRFQNEVVKIVNDIEEEAVEEVAKLYPQLDEATVRGIYWASVNKVKEKVGGAEWLVDTE